MTSNPIVVEVTRGGLVESRHRGALAIADARGTLLLSIGDVGLPVYPRSAVKIIQALPLVEGGAADAFGFTDDQLALAVSSHNGEAPQVAAARDMLRAAGLDETALECGPQPPALDEDRFALRQAGAAPGRIHNNCSGKHAGMIAAARHLGMDTRGYVAADHPLQRRIHAAMQDLAGAELGADRCAGDGCSVPTWAAPLSGWATAFARIATGEGMSPERARAVARIRRAVAANPYMVAGTGRFCTAVMEAAGEAVFVKTGAEGVFCAALPGPGLGIALKIDDGATRAAEILVAAVLAEWAGVGGAARSMLGSLARVPVRDRNGAAVGEMRPAAEIAAEITGALKSRRPQ